jgi:ketosteroid isomerase-like protein
MSEPLTDEEKRSGIHGVDVSKAKASSAPFSIPVCYICHFTEDGKIDRVREYWDVATMTRQFGIESVKSKILGFFIRHQ